MMRRMAAATASQSNRLLADRGLWKDAIYLFALVTYLCSFIFFVLAVGQIVHAGSLQQAMVDILFAIYFLIQVIFLFALSWFVERRRQTLPITFGDRRGRRT